MIGFAAAAFVLVLAVRLPTLGSRLLSNDELVTADTAGLDIVGLIGNRFARAHSPLYFLIVKGLGLAHASDFMIRLPSAIFDGLAAAILAAVLWRNSGRVGALAMTILYAFTPLLIAQGQNARPYAMMNFFFVVAVTGTMVLFRTPRAAAAAFSGRPMAGRPRRTLKIATIAAVCGMAGTGLSLPAGWPALIALQLAVHFQLRRRRPEKFLRLWIVLSLISWAVILPFILAIMSPMADYSGTFWTGNRNQTLIGQAAATIGEVYLLEVIGDVSVFMPDKLHHVVAIALFLLAVLAIWRHWRRPLTTIGALVGIGLPLGLFAISLIQSVLVPRYALLSLICVCMLTADGAAILARQTLGRWIAAMTAAGVILQGLDATISPSKPDWNRIAAYFEDRGVREMHGFTLGQSPTELVRRYLSKRLAIDMERKRDFAELGAAISAKLASDGVIWNFIYGENETNPPGLPPGAVTCRWSFNTTTIFVVARDERSLPPGLAGCRGRFDRIR